MRLWNVFLIRSFLASIKPIINNHCVGHNFENPLGGVTLDSNNISNSYNNIIMQ